MNSQNTMPLISIAMATYNGEKFLREQLDSIYAQTYKNIEVVVTDDGSSDRTVEILKAYRHSHGLKYFVNEKNLGFVKNFEKAVSLCSGEYIALSDQDDIWLPEKLSLLKENIGENLLIFSDAMLCDELGNITSVSQNNIIGQVKDLSSCGKDIIFTRLLYNNFVTGCTVLMKKELIKIAHPIPKGIISHDWWYAICASSRGDIRFYKKALVKYRQHNSNVLGAEKAPSYINNAVKIFSKKYYLYRKKLFYEYSKQLSAEKKCIVFTKSQKEILNDMQALYTDKQFGMVHWNAFRLTCKYRYSIFCENPNFLQYLRCVRSLVW